MTDIFDRDVHCILGLPFDAVDLDAAVGIVQRAAQTREKCFLSTPNLNWLVACQHDRDLRRSVIDSDLSVVDGMPLVWVARWLGVPLRERVAGSAIFDALRGSAAARLRVFFFGGPVGIAEQACRRLNETATGLTCVGHECPGFGSVEEMSSPATIENINRSGADFVVVALGARKGQAWIEHNRGRIEAPVISHLGAVVNFVAGTVSRAPRWMQRSGFEWVWRIKEETGLWRRYFDDGIAFLRLLATRVAPLALLRLTAPAEAADTGTATIEARREGPVSVLILGGAWVRANLAPLRLAFRHATEAKLPIRLDLGGVTYIDGAFVGLLLLLSGHCRRNGMRLEIGTRNRRVERILRYSAVDVPPCGQVIEV